MRKSGIMQLIKKSYPKVEELINKSFLTTDAKEFYKIKYKERMRRLKI